jgi:hypothetical protein
MRYTTLDMVAALLLGAAAMWGWIASHPRNDRRDRREQ